MFSLFRGVGSGGLRGQGGQGGIIEKEAGEQGAGSKGDRTEKGFNPT
ncbi:MAG: hypothetical protein V7L23_19690 [Nostoc sp.]